MGIENLTPINIQQEGPLSIFSRYMAMSVLKDYDLEDIQKINPNFIFEIVQLDDNDLEQNLLEINWEYGFFYAPNAEVKYLVETLYDNRQAKIKAEAIPEEVKLASEVKYKPNRDNDSSIPGLVLP